MVYTGPLFWRMRGTKLTVGLELELGYVPGFDAMREVVPWVAHWFWTLFPGVALLVIYQCLVHGIAGLRRWYLSRRKVPEVVEGRVELRVVVAEPMERRDPVDAYRESFL